MNMNKIIATTAPSPSIKNHFPSTVKDGLLIGIPIAISILAFGAKELIKLEIKRKSAEYSAEIARRKMDQQEKGDRIDYLEKQNQLLLNEILNLRRMMEMSGPLNLAMYDPKIAQKPKAPKAQ